MRFMIILIITAVISGYDQMSVITQPGEIVSHDGYGKENYPPNTDRKYEIRGKPGYDIVFKFVDLDLEDSNSCFFDYVSISGESMDSVKYFCGSDLPEYPIVIMSEKAYLEFVSDEGNEGRGFTIEWSLRKVFNSEAKSLIEEKNRECGQRPVRSAVIEKRIVGTPNVGEFVVKLGEFNLADEDHGEESATVVEVVIHEAFGERAHFDHDLALMKLEKPGLKSFDRMKSPVCLPAQVEEFSYYKDRCFIAGWGKTSMCKNVPQYRNKITESMICAGHLQGGMDACKGDSGGPLMCYDKSTSCWTQIGVISYGFECALKQVPGLYADVRTQMAWLNQTIASD
ncbi:Plasma kallikrein [Cichlidogyrus casuarinus]|uniref:Plasma kallikrein n=1 Tax=Cichlidogyrus casuarinus TaxID=1844966 RepID=A0ABD2PYQ9_9PLAT